MANDVGLMGNNEVAEEAEEPEESEESGLDSFERRKKNKQKSAEAAAAAESESAGDIRSPDSQGALDVGYWCDQYEQDAVTKSNGDFILDSPSFRHPDLGLSSFGGRKRRADLDDERIIGGQDVQDHAWKWIAYFYGCGATLVASDWAVTAAHCCTIPCKINIQYVPPNTVLSMVF